MNKKLYILFFILGLSNQTFGMTISDANDEIANIKTHGTYSSIIGLQGQVYDKWVLEAPIQGAFGMCWGKKEHIVEEISGINSTTGLPYFRPNNYSIYKPYLVTQCLRAALPVAFSVGTLYFVYKRNLSVQRLIFQASSNLISALKDSLDSVKHIFTRA